MRMILGMVGIASLVAGCGSASIPAGSAASALGITGYRLTSGETLRIEILGAGDVARFGEIEVSPMDETVPMGDDTFHARVLVAYRASASEAFASKIKLTKQSGLPSAMNVDASQAPWMQALVDPALAPRFVERGVSFVNQAPPAEERGYDLTGNCRFDSSPPPGCWMYDCYAWGSTFNGNETCDECLSSSCCNGAENEYVYSTCDQDREGCVVTVQRLCGSNCIGSPSPCGTDFGPRGCKIMGVTDNGSC